MTSEKRAAAERRIPSPAREASEAFTRSLTESAQSAIDQNRARLIPPENVLHFRHGEGWNIRRADASEDVGSFKEVEVLKMMGKDRILSNDLGALLEFIQAMVREFSERDEQLMIETITKAAEQSGNEVSAGDTGSPAEAFLESLRRIKFFADKEGNVSLPQLMLSPEDEKKMREDPRGQDPVFNLEIEAVKLEKGAEAIREELQRLSRYEGFGDSH